MLVKENFHEMDVVPVVPAPSASHPRDKEKLAFASRTERVLTMIRHINQYVTSLSQGTNLAVASVKS